MVMHFLMALFGPHSCLVYLYHLYYSILLQQPDPHHHILHCLEETPVAADSGVYADPVQMFIPLIESNRSMVLEEFSLSSSDSPSEGDDQEDRESILTSRTRSKTEAGASESRKLKTDSFQNMKSDKGNDNQFSRVPTMESNNSMYPVAALSEVRCYRFCLYVRAICTKD